MSSKDVLLMTLLGEDKQYSSQELKKLLKFNSKKKLFNFLLKSISDLLKIIPALEVQYYAKYLKQGFTYLDILKEEGDIKTKTQLEQLQNLILKKQETVISAGQDALNIYKELLVKAMLLVPKSKVKNNKQEKENCLFLLEILIKDVKNYYLLKELINSFPKLIKIINNSNLVETIIREQIRVIKEPVIDNCLLIYYDAILELLVQKTKPTHLKQPLINDLCLVMAALKREKIPRRERKAKLLLLKQIKLKLLKLNEKPKGDLNNKEPEFNLELPLSNNPCAGAPLLFNNKSVDFTDKVMVSIDSAGTKGIDDAFSITELDNGNYCLGIYITDLSALITYQNIFKLNLKPETSQLNIINNNSLVANKARTVIGCLVEIDQKGNLINYNFQRGIIKNNYQLSYKEVDLILQKGNDDYVLTNLINKLDKLSKLLAGNSKGHALYRYLEQVQLKGQKCNNSLAYQMVTEFMILMNYLTAKKATECGYPYLYRVHEQVPLEMVLKEIKGLEKFMRLKGKIKEAMLKELIITSFSKAKYSATNIGHQGLGLAYYSHSTSPLRRFVDLINQKIMVDVFLNQQIDDKVIYFWEKELPVIAERQNIYAEEGSKYIKAYNKTKIK